jgi:predicted secreted protein
MTLEATSHSSHGVPESRSRRLEVLLCDYEQAREDERTFQSQQGTGIALALTAISVLGALAFTIGTKDNQIKVPHGVIAGAPLIVLAVLSYVQATGALAVVRSFYLRALEYDIRAELAASERDVRSYQDRIDHKGRERSGLRVMTHAALVAEFTSLNPDTPKGRTLVQTSMVSAVFTATWFVFGGMVIYLMTRESLPWVLIMALVYGSSALALVLLTYHINRNGRALFAEQVDLLHARLSRGLYPLPRLRKEGERALIPYLTYPRPDDAIKGVFLAAGLASALLLAGGEHLNDLAWPDVVSVVALWVGTEFLLYQARYQWNDIRGHSEDQAAPTSKSRGRLPNVPGAVPSSWIVILLRLYCVAIICAVNYGEYGVDFRVSQALLWAAAGILGLGVVYEISRRRISAAGRGGPLGLSWILLVVGLGYPLRFAIGWYAVGSGFNEAFAWGCVAIWGLGVLFVGATWLLEAASYGAMTTENGCKVLWVNENEIAAKPHLKALLVAARVEMKEGPVSPDAGAVPGRDVKVFKDLARPTWRTPWVLGACVWLAALTGSDGSMAGAGFGPPMWGAAVAIALVLVCAARQSAGDGWKVQLVGPVALVISYVISAHLDHSWFAGENPVLVGLEVVLMFIPALVYTFGFHNLSYEDTRRFFKKIFGKVKAAGVKVYCVVSGIGVSEPLNPTAAVNRAP